jgi:hypothetical protein
VLESWAVSELGSDPARWQAKLAENFWQPPAGGCQPLIYKLINRGLTYDLLIVIKGDNKKTSTFFKCILLRFNTCYNNDMHLILTTTKIAIQMVLNNLVE